MKLDKFISHLATFIGIQLVFIIAMVVENEMWSLQRWIIATAIAYLLAKILQGMNKKQKRGKKNGRTNN